MKKKYITTLLAGTAFVLGSCTGSFEKFNTDETGFPDEKQEMDYNTMGIALKIVQQGIYLNYNWGDGQDWTWQIAQNLNADLFAGYFAPNGDFSQGTNCNIYYNLNDGWCSKGWEYTYGYILPQVKKVEEATEESRPDLYAIAKILKVELMHRISDQYGPIVYSDFGNKTGSKPDSQQEAYGEFFKDLDIAAAKLDAFIKANPSATIEKFDYILGGNYNQWMKFCNSLRLRLAIRICMVDRTKAQAEIDKVFANEYGVFENASDIAQMESSARSGYSNPLATISSSWGNCFMSADMESILSGYEDPRMEQYFRKSENPDLAGQYRGIRLGIDYSGNRNYSQHSKAYAQTTSPAILMTAAEVWFLRAEAALRGFISGDPEEYYEKGVKTSFSQWGCEGAGEYLESENVPSAYTDPLNADNNIAAASQVSPKWGGTQEELLEKIITQKWIACYPEGYEGWAEVRRTGYPKLFKIKNNHSNGVITDMVHRLPFPTSIHSDALYQQVMTLLGGTDNGGTRLWWDTGRNF